MGDLIIFLIWFNYKLGIIFKKGISSFFKLKKKASHDCLEKIKIIKLKKSWKLYTIKIKTINNKIVHDQIIFNNKIIVSIYL